MPDAGAEENFVVGRRIHPDITTLTDLFNGINVGLLELAEPLVFHGERPATSYLGILKSSSGFSFFPLHPLFLFISEV